MEKHVLGVHIRGGVSDPTFGVCECDNLTACKYSEPAGVTASTLARGITLWIDGDGGTRLQKWV